MTRVAIRSQSRQWRSRGPINRVLWLELTITPPPSPKPQAGNMSAELEGQTKVR